MKSAFNSETSFTPATKDAFVGREAEFADLTRSLKDAVSGHGRLVLIEGEPGIGKSSLVRRLSAVARAEGCQVLAGECPEEPGAPPYYMWTRAMGGDIVAGTVTAQASSTVEAGLRTHVANAVGPVPLQTGPIEEPGAARFRLFESVTGALVRRASLKPLVLVLEDIQWADRSSMLLLEFVSQRISQARLLLMVTCRDHESAAPDLSETLASLARQPAFSAIRLSGLDVGDTAKLVTLASGGAVGPGEAAELHRRAEGNPFFVLELLRDLRHEQAAGHAVERSAGRQRIPVTVRGAIARRASRLSEECRDFLTTAAVLGREFDINVVRLLRHDFSMRAAAHLAGEAARAGFIAQTPAAPRTYRFAHALFQDCFASGFTSDEKAGVHMAAAQVLEREYQEAAAEHAAELARHWFAAVPAAGPERALFYLELAGEQAISAHAYHEAVGLFQSALGLLAAGQDKRRADLLFGLGRALAASLPMRQLKAANNSLVQAFEIYFAGHDWRRSADVAMAMPHLPQGNADVLTAVERCLGMPQVAGALRAELLLGYASLAMAERNDEAAARKALEDSRASAGRSAGAHFTARLKLTALTLDASALNWSERGIEDAASNVRAAVQLRDRSLELQTRYFVGPLLTSSGRLDDALENTSAMLAAAQGYHSSEWAERAAGISWTAAYCAGDLERALELVAPHSSKGPYWAGLAAVAECQSGNTRRVEALLRAVLDSWEAYSPSARAFVNVAVPSSFAACSLVTGDTRHLDFAERLAREAIGNPATYRLRASVSWQTLGIAAVLRKDRGACDAAYRALSPMPRYIGNFPFVEKERLLALLASRVGMHDEAAGHFERSLAFCRQARYPLELAWTCHDFAAFLADRAEPGDAAYGTTLAREGIAVARRYGLTVAADRLSRLRRRLLAMRQRREPLAGGLTEAEARVLDLLERGLSNKAMSSELTVSVATVATHIRSIYRKLGVANRTEAAVRATALRSGNKYRLNG